MLSQLSYTAQDSRLKGGTVRSRLGPFMSTINPASSPEAWPWVNLIREIPQLSFLLPQWFQVWVKWNTNGHKHLLHANKHSKWAWHRQLQKTEWAFSTQVSIAQTPTSVSFIVFFCLSPKCQWMTLEALSSSSPGDKKKSDFSFTLPPRLSLTKSWTGFLWVKCLFRLMERIQVPQC